MMHDTTHEIDELQNELWMKKTPQERTRFASAMFSANRRVILTSLSEGLSENEIKRQLFYRTYGEHLPDDFFDRD